MDMLNTLIGSAGLAYRIFITSLGVLLLSFVISLLRATGTDPHKIAELFHHYPAAFAFIMFVMVIWILAYIAAVQSQNVVIIRSAKHEVKKEMHALGLDALADRIEELAETQAELNQRVEAQVERSSPKAESPKDDCPAMIGPSNP